MQTTDAAPPAGLLLQSADNGSATRNGSVYAGQLGAGAIVMPGRTYHAPDKPFVERPFGTLQWQVLNFLPGYAGSRPGELEGYDPKASAKLTHDQLYGTITQFFVDEYSRREHNGTWVCSKPPPGKNSSKCSMFTVELKLHRSAIGVFTSA